MNEGSVDWLVYSSVKLARTTVPAISSDASEFSPGQRLRSQGWMLS